MVPDKKDNEEAIKNVLTTYGNLLYRTAYIFLGNPHDVQDILQETLIKYMEKAPVFREKEHEKAWLLKVTSNLCRDFLRFHRRHACVNLDDLENLPVPPDQRDFIREITALPAKWKSVLLLHYVEGYSIKETAKITGLTENAVKKRLQRGRDALKKQLAESEGLYEQYQ